MIASLIILMVILASVAVVYTQGSLAKGVISIVFTLGAAIIAFSYFEAVTGLFLKHIPSMAAWAQTASFAILFLFSFIFMQIGASFLLRDKVNFGELPEKIGRIVSGIFLGLLLAGVLLTSLAMAPVPAKYPYQRFEQTNPNPDEPKKPFPNADGLVVGLYSLASKGSLSGKNSFAVLHPNYLNQVHLNRLVAPKQVETLVDNPTIRAPAKNGVWRAPEDLTDSEGNAIPQKAGHTLMIVRVEFRRSATLTLAQLRLICKDRNQMTDPLAGSAVNVYPIGYMKEPGKIETKRLSQQIRITRSSDGNRVIDFAFQVPSGTEPLLVQLKANDLARVSSIVGQDQIPEPAYFSSGSDKSNNDGNGTDSNSDRQNQNNDSEQSSNSGRRGLSPIGRSVTGDAASEEGPILGP